MPAGADPGTVVAVPVRPSCSSWAWAASADSPFKAGTVTVPAPLEIRIEIVAPSSAVSPPAGICDTT